MDLCHRLHSLNETFIDGVWTNSGGNVSAVHGLSDNGRVDVHLAEIVIHVDSRALTLLDNGYLTCGCIRAAHAVDLASVRASERA